MIGAIIGDIVGSRFEWNPIKSKQFDLFTKECRFTDDTVMTCAVAQALLDWIEGNRKQDLQQLFTKSMYEFGNKYPDAGFGGMFLDWLHSKNPKPYNSFGNGSAMRVSACGWIGTSLEEVLELAKISALPTHNHPEGIKGAQATAACIYLARTGKKKAEIKKYIQDNFYDLNFSLDEIRSDYKFDTTCQGSVPQAIECFLESDSFEDCLRNAISLGGDSDTIGAIAGAIAEAYYGSNKLLTLSAFNYLDKDLKNLVGRFFNFIQKNNN